MANRPEVLLKSNTTEEALEIMQAFLDGKQIQWRFRTIRDTWEDVDFIGSCTKPDQPDNLRRRPPVWDFQKYVYRIKPEPVYINKYKLTDGRIVMFTYASKDEAIKYADDATQNTNHVLIAKATPYVPSQDDA